MKDGLIFQQIQKNVFFGFHPSIRKAGSGPPHLPGGIVAVKKIDRSGSVQKKSNKTAGPGR
jgi:hypothetical protein